MLQFQGAVSFLGMYCRSNLTACLQIDSYYIIREQQIYVRGRKINCDEKYIDKVF